MMGRQLEFRAWHMPNKTIWPTSFFNEEDVWREWDYNKTDDENYLIVDNALPRRECIMFQFTGMHDEYGNALWEGDVLRLDIAQLPEDLASGGQEYSRYYYVAYHNGGFAAVMMGVYLAEVESWTIDYFSDYRQGAISDTQVGCLYKHPELVLLTETYPIRLRELSTREQFVHQSAEVC